MDCTNNAMLILTAEKQLKSFGAFLEEHDNKLNRLLPQREKKLLLPPVVVAELNCREQLSVIKLLESDRLLNKTLLTFAIIANEIESIVQEAERIQRQFLYIDENLCVSDIGHDANGGQQPNNEAVLSKMSSSIQLLFHIQSLLQRCTILGNNLLHQCGAFLQDCGTLEFKLFNMFDVLAELLTQILIFDEILSASTFSRFWSHYKSTVDSLAHNSDVMADCSQSELNGLKNCLQEIDILFSKTLFRNFLDSTFALKDKIGTTGMGTLVQQCNEYMKRTLATVDTFQVNELNDFDESRLIVRLNVFCVLFHDFGGQVDSKHVKRLLELNAKHQGIILITNISWEPSIFLCQHAESLVKNYQKQMQEDKRQSQIYLSSRLQTLQKDCRAHISRAILWALHVRKSLSVDPLDLQVDHFKKLADMLLKGQQHAGQISFMVKALVNAHVRMRMPMTKQTLLLICRLIEVLKLLQAIYQEHSVQISKVMQCVLHYLQYKLLHLLAASKKKVTGNTKMHDRNVDALAAIKIAEKCMSGPPTTIRMLITKFAINAINANNYSLPADQYQKATSLIKRIEVLCNFRLHMQQVCETTYLYWYRSMLTAYLRQILDRKLDLNAFAYFINASNDCNKALDALESSSGMELELTATLKRINHEHLRNEIISGLCAQIETFLRLEVHTNLQLDRINPFEQKNVISDYCDLINYYPILHNGRYVVLKDYVENYLSSMFYNLTTISLHDWKTYEEMRHLAQNRLSLHAVDDYLPNQTLEQGIDILEIMRKIHIFVSKYVYNMNSQIFVEQHSVNKHLDSIGIRHVANSLRTHGSGVINTTVNFTYQFLRQKFYTFSQFLYDEQIKARLMKEFRSYSDRKKANTLPLYPYERADAFNKDIRKLGLSNDGQTYMDLFRRVITHVGNAVGYIRLVRSGNIHANYSASLYLPKFEEHLRFLEHCKSLNLNETTILAAENFESNVSNLVLNFSQNTEYFKILVEVFEPFFRNPHNLHLKNFFLIVPPLILNYVQHMLNVKEKINKRDRQEALLFDDGFAVGLAYILKLLDQVNDFNALQWFGTVRDRFNAERRKIQQMLATINMESQKSTTTAKNKSEQEKLQQTIALTERRITTHQNEYNLLYYNLSSAKIFFQ